MQIINLNRHEQAALRSSYTFGSGGFQSLLRKLNNQLDAATGRLILEAADAERVLRYALGYGNGGWEARLTSVFGRHLSFDRQEA